LLHLSWKGTNKIACQTQLTRGEDLGWFQHASTILLFAPRGCTPCGGGHPSACIGMGSRGMPISPFFQSALPGYSLPATANGPAKNPGFRESFSNDAPCVAAARILAPTLKTKTPDPTDLCLYLLTNRDAKGLAKDFLESLDWHVCCPKWGGATVDHSPRKAARRLAPTHGRRPVARNL